jgi:hypothetical protein
MTGMEHTAHIHGLCALNGDWRTRTRITELSKWVDDANADRGEALTWSRVAKVGEESGEALSALLGYVGQNPRKGYYADAQEVVKELLDVALAALGAVEHMTDNKGHALRLFREHVEAVHARAGLGATA